MKATVKVAYFDNAGLHKPREVVEVKAPNPYVEIIAEKEKPAEIKTEEKAETKKNKPRKKEG